MKVTESRYKNRQLHIEDYLQRLISKLKETREKVEVMECRWMNFCPSLEKTREA